MINAAIVGLGWWGRTLVESAQGSDFIRFVAGATRTVSPEVKTFTDTHKLRLAACDIMLRLRRLMCGRSVTFREGAISFWGYAPSRLRGAAPGKYLGLQREVGDPPHIRRRSRKTLGEETERHDVAETAQPKQ